MSVVVKGMRMPENCNVCRFSDWSNLHQTASCKLKDYQPCFSNYSTEYITQRSTICPLVDLGKHGGLIDADKLIIDLMDRGLEGVQTDDYSEIQQTILVQDTVIEAEDGT